MIPPRVAVAIVSLAGFLGWTVGGFHAERRAAIEWTAASITHEFKSALR